MRVLFITTTQNFSEIVKKFLYRSQEILLVILNAFKETFLNVIFFVLHQILLNKTPS